MTSTSNNVITFKGRNKYSIPDYESVEIDIFGQALTTTDGG